MAESKVIVVEDEREIRELMSLMLSRQGLVVKECGTAEEALGELTKTRYNLAVVDWMLPGASGVELVSVIKKNTPEVGVLMVTAKTEPQDIVVGLEKGADDYLTKPFEPTVFLARVKALLRRNQILTPKPNFSEANKDLIQVEGLEINLASYEVKVGQELLHLTPSEFKLLVSLVSHRGRVLTRESLIENIQGEGVNVIGRTVDTHVFGLRKKLGVWGENIETIRGVGYRVRIV
ncbi:MAG TPA: response regulator transcription factor [Pseudobdellovibrionaceae bacterium]|nr:response regulator transcription factor [Pseudobdellovibrionaceae bacterium]